MLYKNKLDKFISQKQNNIRIIGVENLSNENEESKNCTEVVKRRDLKMIDKEISEEKEINYNGMVHSSFQTPPIPSKSAQRISIGLDENDSNPMVIKTVFNSNKNLKQSNHDIMISHKSIPSSDDDMDVDENPDRRSTPKESKSESKQTSPKVILEQIENNNHEEDSNFQQHFSQDAPCEVQQDDTKDLRREEETKEYGQDNHEDKLVEKKIVKNYSDKHDEEEKESIDNRKYCEHQSNSSDDSDDLRGQVFNLSTDFNQAPNNQCKKKVTRKKRKERKPKPNISEKKQKFDSEPKSKTELWTWEDLLNNKELLK